MTEDHLLPGESAEPTELTSKLVMIPQPDDSTCGPTCLHAVYRFYGETLELPAVIEEVDTLSTGGTLAVLLAVHALKRGYRAKIITANLQIFDPTWFDEDIDVDIADRLKRQIRFKFDHRLEAATRAYLEFLELGGRVGLEDFNPALIRRYMKRDVPILTGLSATWLYRNAREYGPNDDPDDVRGEAAGHFVVLCGYDPKTRHVLVADPHRSNPISPTLHYSAGIDRILNAILLGVLTQDANLLIIEPAHQRRHERQPGRDGRPG